MASRLMSARMSTSALVEKISVTSANVNDGRAGPDSLPDDPGEAFADSAYRGPHFGDAVRATDGTPCVVATGMWGPDETEVQARLQAWNQPIHRVRARIEKIFGTCKRSYGLHRMRWRVSPKPPSKFTSPPSPTISNAPVGRRSRRLTLKTRSARQPTPAIGQAGNSQARAVYSGPCTGLSRSHTHKWDSLGSGVLIH